VASISASVYIQLLKYTQRSCCTEKCWRCQSASLVFSPTPCDSQPQPESVRRVVVVGVRVRKEKGKKKAGEGEAP